MPAIASQINTKSRQEHHVVTLQRERNAELREQQEKEEIIASITSEAEEASGEEIGTEDVKIILDAPEKMEFPTFIFMIAAFEDTVIDIFLDGTGIGVLAGMITSWIILIIIWFWLRGKLNMLQKQGLRLLFGMIIETIPFIDWIPTYSMFIVLAHYRHNTVVEAVLKVAEHLARKKLGNKRSGRIKAAMLSKI